MTRWTVVRRGGGLRPPGGHDDPVRRVDHVPVAYRAGPWARVDEEWPQADRPGVSGAPAPEYRTKPSP